MNPNQERDTHLPLSTATRNFGSNPQSNTRQPVTSRDKFPHSTSTPHSSVSSPKLADHLSLGLLTHPMVTVLGDSVHDLGWGVGSLHKDIGAMAHG